jgi:phospholipid/cholesterol/gamma-HCH transport system permease protein
MVMSLQSVYAFRQFGLESFSGGTTGIALGRELGPVLTSLMLAGRAGRFAARTISRPRSTSGSAVYRSCCSWARSPAW